MKTTKVHGIYRITNVVNGKFYIGSAKSLSNRFATHRKDLRKNQHHNTHLQAAWNKYGEDSFLFSVEEVLNCAEDLFDREQYYLDTLKPYEKGVGYNKSKSARTCLGVKPSEETKKRQSEAAKKRFLLEPQKSGEESHAAKITQVIANEMISLYRTGDFTAEKLSSIYKISREQINAIMRGEYWKNPEFVYPIIPLRIFPLAKEIAIEYFDFIDIRVKTGDSWNSIAKQLRIDYRLLRKEYEKIKNEM